MIRKKNIDAYLISALLLGAIVVIWTLIYNSDNALLRLVALITGSILNFVMFYIIYILYTGKEKASSTAREMTEKFEETISFSEKKSIELSEKTKTLAEQNQTLEDTKRAMLNLLEDLNAEKNSADAERIRDEAMLESIGNGIIAGNKDGTISLINKAAEEYLSVTHKNIIGKSIVDVIPMEDENGHLLPFEKSPLGITLSEGKTIATSISPAYYFVREDGTKFPVSVISTPIILQGEISGFIVSFRDITREKEIDRSKSEFVSIASHQLRGPLAITSWYIELLLEKETGKLNKEQKDYLLEVYKANQRMIELVSALLQVSRIEMGTFDIERKLVDPRKEIDTALEVFAPQIKDKELKIVKDYGEAPVSIETDQTVIGIILQNFISNAIKYNVKGGMITVVVKMQDHDILIQVSDTGIGIPKDQQYKVFEKFFRANNAAKIDPSGNGLGLYIVRLVIEKAKGKI